ncbi:MAG: type II secretion system F family protein [Myxococcota bacterium]
MSSPSSLQVGLVVGVVLAGIVAPWSGRPWIAVGLGAIAGALAFIAHRTAADRADLTLEEGLADALDLVTSALRAGASPLDALRRAARDAREPLRGLLTDLTGRLAAGEAPVDATRRLLEEAPLESVRLLVLCLSVQWHAGGQLSRSLALVSRTVRDRADVLRRVETQAAPTRGSVLLLMAANVAIAGIVWSNDPAGIGMFLDSGIGTGLVSGTLLCQAISLVWMWRLSRIPL